MAKLKTRMPLPSDASEAVALLKRKGWPQDAMDDLAAGRAKLIPLTRGEFALVDSCDYEVFMKHLWFCHATGYAVRGDYSGPKRKAIIMHRVINGTPNGMLSDHINRIRLDNRRCNLRHVNRLQNSWNRTIGPRNKTGFKGVYYDRNKWRSMFWLNKKKVDLGRFETPQEAHEAYRCAITKARGEFASLV